MRLQVETSSADNSSEAGEEAVENVYTENTDLIYAFESTEHDLKKAVESEIVNTPVFGLFAFGQIATSNGRPAFHEETASIQVLGEK